MQRRQRHGPLPSPVPDHRFRLEQLYERQAPDLVIDTIPSLIAWLPARPDPNPSHQFDVDVKRGQTGPITRETLLLEWDLEPLIRWDPALLGRVERLRAGRTAHREHTAEVAAYGLALAAISVFLPGRRVIAWSKYVAPDLLFDATPGARRGVEVAGRTSGGEAALLALRDGRRGRPGKAEELRKDPEVAEAWLSLWSGRPSVAKMVHVKP